MDETECIELIYNYRISQMKALQFNTFLDIYNKRLLKLNMNIKIFFYGHLGKKINCCHGQQVM